MVGLQWSTRLDGKHGVFPDAMQVSGCRKTDKSGTVMILSATGIGASGEPRLLMEDWIERGRGSLERRLV